MAKEVVQSISEYFINDGQKGIELTRDILYYLYHTTNDNKLKEVIIEWFNDENYCIQCSNKMNEKCRCELCDKKKN